MATRPCNKAVTCPGSDFPISNYTAEGADPNVFTSVYYKWGCLAVCTSEVSQEEADLCALAQEVLCVPDPPDPPFPPPPPPPPPPDPPEDPPPPPEPPVDPPVVSVYLRYNTAQTCCTPCPDGTSFCYTVPANTFSNWTQAAADAQAYAYACVLAKKNKLCLSDIENCACSGEAYSAEIAASVAKSLAWSVVSGSLPDGLTLSSAVTTDGKVYLIGTPTTTGAFTFTIMALASNGSYATKEYTLNILSIVDSAMDDFTVGTPYIWTFQGTGGAGVPYYRFTIVDGSLPAGLTMDEYGRITGTPTEGGDHTFTIEMEDIETCQ